MPWLHRLGWTWLRCWAGGPRIASAIIAKRNQFCNFRRRPIQSMRNDLTKTMGMTIWPETCQKTCFLTNSCLELPRWESRSESTKNNNTETRGIPDEPPHQCTQSSKMCCSGPASDRRQSWQDGIGKTTLPKFLTCSPPDELYPFTLAPRNPHQDKEQTTYVMACFAGTARNLKKSGKTD